MTIIKLQGKIVNFFSFSFTLLERLACLYNVYMKTIGCITFHASFNYGSCLQAFALQKFVEGLEPGSLNYSIVNLRTKKQKALYQPIFGSKNWKDIIRIPFILFEKNTLKTKNNLFETFISKELKLTTMFADEESLKANPPVFDIYVCGSDQIWNIHSFDFDWSYFLEFVKSGKKIAYAPSCGTKPIVPSNEENQRLKKDLSSFQAIRVRDAATQAMVSPLVGFEPQIAVDPTMLLTKDQWLPLLSKASATAKHLPKSYILFYDLSHDREKWKMARAVAKKLKKPLVITTVPSLRTITLSVGCKKIFAVGPWEFLKILNNAALVLTSSFHGAVFSVLLDKPFYSIKGLEDERVKTFLKLTNLEKRNLASLSEARGIKDPFWFDYSFSKKAIDTERQKSIHFFEEVLKND